MPDMTIQLRCDPVSGRRDIVVKLHGDAELLPHEHEQLHRKLVDKLIEGSLIKAGEGGRLIIERAEGVDVVAPSAASDDPDRRATKTGQ